MPKGEYNGDKTMMYMIGLAVVLALFGFLPEQYGLRQKNYKGYIVICGILIALIMGLRTQYTGSGDSIAYCTKFDQMRRYSNFGDYFDKHLASSDFLFSETGFYFLTWLLGRIFDDSQVFLFLTSVFTTWAVCRFVSRNSANASISLIVYVCLGLFTFNMNGIRQALAMSVCLFSYEYVKKRKLLPFILLILVAMQFHKTAICFVPMYILPSMKFSKGNLLIYICGVMLFLLFLDNLILAYNDWSSKEYDSTDSASGGGLFVILIYLFALVIALMQPDLVREQGTGMVCFAVIAGLAAYVARYFSNQMMERISFYYFYFVTLLIPASIEKMGARESKMIRWAFIIGAIALFAYRTYTGQFRDFRLYFS